MSRYDNDSSPLWGAIFPIAVVAISLTLLIFCTVIIKKEHDSKAQEEINQNAMKQNALQWQLAKKEQLAHSEVEHPVEILHAPIPANYILVEDIAGMIDGQTVWAPPESMVVTSKQVYLTADTKVSLSKQPNYIRITKCGETFKVNLEGTSYRWKIVNPVSVLLSGAVKVQDVEQDVPVER